MSSVPGNGPLAGLKVIEMGAFIAGPFCSQLLADLGAEVIKLEPPAGGDPMRQWGVERTASGRALWWSIIGRNKKSLTLDLRQPDGQEIARALIGQADVLIENFRPGTLERWNLSPDALRQASPDLIVARVSGFGQDGPYRSRPGFGAIAESMAGLRHLTGYPGEVPARVGISIGDSLAGLYGCVGILASLCARGRQTAGGQVVDVAIAESVLGVLESVIAEYAATGAVRQRTGPVLPRIAPSNLYPTQDGRFVLIAANADGLFRRLANAMGAPELADDPRYTTHAARGMRQAELDERIGRWTETLTAEALLGKMEEVGVPAGPVNDAAAVAADPHFRARGAIVEVPDPEIGSVMMQGVFPKLSETPGRIAWTGPALGEHTEEILRERLGMTPQRVAELRAAGVA
ncbi:MAG: CoA transferase [Proteobacteria bacterium]|nr:CoA transferase [Pseudomonadota bacterium]